MPFKKIEVSEEVKKLRKDIEFDREYREITKEYELIRLIVERRKMLKISQNELAEMVGVSQQNISRMETERHIPKLSLFLKIMDALDLSMIIQNKNDEKFVIGV